MIDFSSLRVKDDAPFVIIIESKVPERIVSALLQT